MYAVNSPSNAIMLCRMFMDQGSAELIHGGMSHRTLKINKFLLLSSGDCVHILVAPPSAVVTMACEQYIIAIVLTITRIF